jgi:predicted transcriptional regulator of viral defense system
MKIDRNRLQAKYVLEIYKMVDGYPSTIDLLYEIVTVLSERKKLEDSFVSTDILKEVTTRLEEKSLEESLPKLQKEGWLEFSNGAYRVIKHPWI